MHGRVPPTAFFALPFIYGYPFLFGFVNFTLSVALAFLAFGLWLRLGRLERTSLRELAVRADLARRVLHPHLRLGPARPDVFFGRGGAAARPRAQLVARRARAALHTSVMALPLLVMFVWRSETHGGQTYRLVRMEDEVALDLSALRDRWKLFDIGSLVVAARCSSTRSVSRKLTLSRNLVFSAIVLARLVRDPAADRVRIGLCRHAAGAVPDGGGDARNPLSRTGASQDRQYARGDRLIFFATRTVANTISLGMAANDQTAKLRAIDPCPREPA